MPLPANTDASAPALPALGAIAAASPRSGWNTTPLKALAGGVLIGVVIGGFVSPIASRLAVPYSVESTTSAPGGSVQVASTARSQIQDARAATTQGAKSDAAPTDAGQPLTLSNAATETER